MLTHTVEFQELCFRGHTLISSARVTKGGGAEATGQSEPPLSFPLPGQLTPTHCSILTREMATVISLLPMGQPFHRDRRTPA